MGKKRHALTAKLPFTLLNLWSCSDSKKTHLHAQLCSKMDAEYPENGILDCKWSHHRLLEGKPTLALATSGDGVSLRTLSKTPASGIDFSEVRACDAEATAKGPCRISRQTNEPFFTVSFPSTKGRLLYHLIGTIDAFVPAIHLLPSVCRMDMREYTALQRRRLLVPYNLSLRIHGLSTPAPLVVS